MLSSHQNGDVTMNVVWSQERDPTSEIYGDCLWFIEKHSLALLPGGQWYRSTLETWPSYHHYNDVIMGVSNHQPHNCLLNRSFRRRSKKTSKPRVTGLCAGNSPVTGELSAQRSNNAENVSICWRHHESPWYPRKELAIGSYWYFRNHFSHRVFKDVYPNCLSYRYRNSHHQDRTRPFYIYDRISYTSQDGLYRLLKKTNVIVVAITVDITSLQLIWRLVVLDFTRGYVIYNWVTIYWEIEYQQSEFNNGRHVMHLIIVLLLVSWRRRCYNRRYITENTVSANTNLCLIPHKNITLVTHCLCTHHQPCTWAMHITW